MRIFVIAGEASGDRLGGALMRGLRSLAEVEFQGVGGPLMQAEGLTPLFAMDELSVHGLVEVLGRYRGLRRRLREVSRAAVEARPDALVTIDSPDFCLRVAKRVKARSTARTIHYVAPSVWAWRAGRAKRMARHIDHVLALLPFEPPYMEAAGIACDFVGHPVVCERQATEAERRDFRCRHGIGDSPLLAVLPGSRRSEVSRLGPVFAEALERVAAERPSLRIVVPATAARAAQVREMAARWPGRPVIVAPDGADEEAHAFEKACALGAADFALAASGTVSLELAAAGTPMLIAYDGNPLTRAIVTRMLRVDTVTLVNLVSGTRAVPEYLCRDCVPSKLAAGLIRLMDDPGGQAEAMRLTMERLGLGGEDPGLRAAKAVIAGLRRDSAGPGG